MTILGPYLGICVAWFFFGVSSMKMTKSIQCLGLAKICQKSQKVAIFRFSQKRYEALISSRVGLNIRTSENFVFITLNPSNPLKTKPLVFFLTPLPPTPGS